VHFAAACPTRFRLLLDCRQRRGRIARGKSCPFRSAPPPRDAFLFSPRLTRPCRDVERPVSQRAGVLGTLRALASACCLTSLIPPPTLFRFWLTTPLLLTGPSPPTRPERDGPGEPSFPSLPFPGALPPMMQTIAFNSQFPLERAPREGSRLPHVARRAIPSANLPANPSRAGAEPGCQSARPSGGGG
jgi:hypothetical protein